MISPFQIYLIYKCNWFSTVFFLASCVSFFFLMVVAIGMTFDNVEEKRGAKAIKITAAVFGIFLFAAVATPTTEEAMRMVSIPAIEKSFLEQKEIPKEIRKLWEDFADYTRRDN